MVAVTSTRVRRPGPGHLPRTIINRVSLSLVKGRMGLHGPRRPLVVRRSCMRLRRPPNRSGCRGSRASSSMPTIAVPSRASGATSFPPPPPPPPRIDRYRGSGRGQLHPQTASKCSSQQSWSAIVTWGGAHRSPVPRRCRWSWRIRTGRVTLGAHQPSMACTVSFGEVDLQDCRRNPRANLSARRVRAARRVTSSVLIGRPTSPSCLARIPSGPAVGTCSFLVRRDPGSGYGKPL